MFGVREFFPYLRAGAVDIIMPDMKFCGGMYEHKKIAAMAQGSGVKASPHGPASPIGNIAVSVESAFFVPGGLQFHERQC